VGGLGAEELFPQHAEAGQGPDFRAKPVGEHECDTEQRVAVLDHLPAPAVERRVDHHVRAGGHQHVGAGGQLGRVHQGALDVEDRSLLEPGAHLLHADHADVRAGVHGPGRQVLVERQMGAPGFVDDQRLAPPVADAGDRLDVGAGAVRGGTDNQRAGRVRMVLPGLLDLARRGRVGQVQPFVVPRPDPLRLYPAEDQPGHDRFVRVPADQQVSPAAGHGQHGRLDRKRAAARREESMLRADGVGHQLLGRGQVARPRTYGHRVRPWRAGPNGTRPGRSR
jgi:hypothetical protein